ncbi:MAG TPA: CocE/NonD family hydrolase, partial [Gemmatimonadales bacterium]
MSNLNVRVRAGRWLVLGLALAASGGCTRSATSKLAGEWDVYIALGSKPKFGFEGWRRMAFAHFSNADSGSVGFMLRRAGGSMLDVRRVSTNGDSVTLWQDSSTEVRAAWHGDTLSGQQFTRGKAQDRRLRLVRRSTPGVVERDYQVWTMPASDSQYAVTEDTLVFMRTRDGAKLATYIARPVGKGPFGVVLQRTPYRRVLHPAGRWWASHGYIFVAQHVRGRDQSSGDVKDFGDYTTDREDGYDAVEWAAKLPGANGKVGMIGHSDEGRLVWYAAVSNPPHLAAISPTAASPDPWVVVPYA